MIVYTDNHIMNLLKIGKILLVILLVVVVLNLVLERENADREVKFGVTFSPRYARYLKLDWRRTYFQILDDLKIKNLRLTTYWDLLEEKQNQYDFSETDFMLDEAQKREAKVILVIGARQPRWPECHIPGWAKRLTVSQRQQKILEFIQKVTERYKNHPTIWAWQIENEPLLGSFGEGCDRPDKIFLEKEVELVRRISNKVIILTDSGELGFWATSMQFSDIFGTTLYRQVYNELLGYITYPFPPSFYGVKSNLIRKVFAPDNSKTIVVELQAEPWLADGILKAPKEQAELFPASKIESYVNYAKKTGFDQVYLWGVEWWYFMAQQGYFQYLNYAETLFK